MELKAYQQQVLDDLAEFIDETVRTPNLSTAFYNFWKDKGVTLEEWSRYLSPYDNSVQGVPRVTVKVPTAGGKTFIACNALHTIFEHLPKSGSKVVAWFVPSDTILKQTYNNLSNPLHPYRQKINALFGNSVEVYSKEELLSGRNFSPETVKEQLCILVLSIQSFAAKEKDKRLVYGENGNLAPFVNTYNQNDVMIDDADETALIQVISHLHPVVIVDESHNFTAKLRIDVMNALRPRFILDLTATPSQKKGNNIISFVDAKKLKDANMVKLPVIVYNHKTKEEVISSAIQLRNNLELIAREKEQVSGKYIRPIVLFQAEAKTSDDKETFSKVKAKLIEIGIPEREIKIKTANINELKDENLMSRHCEVRYIITVNALKEGWDCPFAYILASLSNKSSRIDVEQILGRVLRMPYTSKADDPLLGLSYVFTASANFNDTLNAIVKSLNNSGYSSRDYKLGNNEPPKPLSSQPEQLKLDLENPNPIVPEEEDDSVPVHDIDVSQVNIQPCKASAYQMQQAISISKKYDEEIREIKDEVNDLPTDLISDNPNKSCIRPQFKDIAKTIKLPVFAVRAFSNNLFGSEESLEDLTPEMLVDDDFKLNMADCNIDYDKISAQAAQIDIDKVSDKDYTANYTLLKSEEKEYLRKYIASQPTEAKQNQIVLKILEQLKRIDQIPYGDLKEYITKSIMSLDNDSLDNVFTYAMEAANKVKRKIASLMEEYATKRFYEWCETGEIVLKPSFIFKRTIYPDGVSVPINNRLYEKEGKFDNTFEQTVISKIASLGNVEFWHRNLERGKGFCLNGAIRHYPDFIIVMHSGVVVLVETKGDDRDNSDSKAKLALGNEWQKKAGTDKYKYYMVFENNSIPGSKSVDDLLNILEKL